MPYQPATNGINVQFGYSPAQADFVEQQMGTATNDGVGHIYAPAIVANNANLDTGALITATGATTSQTGADQLNNTGRGLIVVLDMTTVGTGSVTLTIQGKDTASGKYYTLLAGAAVVANSTNVYTVYPGVAATANVSANSPLPRTWRVITTANNANPCTYTVGASVIE